MKRIGIVGGETHIHHVTSLADKRLEIAGTCVRSDLQDWAQTQFSCPVTSKLDELLNMPDIELVAVANENDLRAETIQSAIHAGCDVITDKPLAITIDEQRGIEEAIADRPERRLLMLLGRRADPAYQGMRKLVESGRIGEPTFVHIRMAVQLKPDKRPPWFLDAKRSGGIILDLLIHGIDQVEWQTGKRIEAITATMGNLGNPDQKYITDYASVFCELEGGGNAVVEGQRMLPDTRHNDYRMTIAGTRGYADLMADRQLSLTVTDRKAAGTKIENLPDRFSIVEDWLDGGEYIGTWASLRANRLAVLATLASETKKRIRMDDYA